MQNLKGNQFSILPFLKICKFFSFLVFFTFFPAKFRLAKLKLANNIGKT